MMDAASLTGEFYSSQTPAALRMYRNECSFSNIFMKQGCVFYILEPLRRKYKHTTSFIKTV